MYTFLYGRGIFRFSFPPGSVVAFFFLFRKLPDCFKEDSSFYIPACSTGGLQLPHGPVAGFLTILVGVMGILTASDVHFPQG